MALSLDDLDRLLEYPHTGAIHAAARAAIAQPSIPNVGNAGTLLTDPRMPAVRNVNAELHPLARPARPATAAGIPSLGVPDSGAPNLSVPPTSIPNLMAPTRKESIAAGKAENAGRIADLNAGIQRASQEHGAMSPEYFAAEREKSDWQKLHPWGTDVSAHPGFGGKVGHVLSRIANVAGDIAAPATMALIPGTQLHDQFERTGQMRGFNQATENEFKNAQTQGLERENELVPWTTPSGEQEQVTRREWGPLTEAREKEQAEATRATEGEKEREAAAEKARQETQTADEKRQQERLDAEESGRQETIAAEDAREKARLAQQQPGTYQPYYDKDGNVVGFYNTKNPRNLITNAPIPQGASTAAGQGMNEKQQAAFNKGYVDPANAIERSYEMFEGAYNAYKQGDVKTGAEDMLMLSQHLATTFGQVKGSRMNRDLIQEHKNAIGLQDRIERFANSLANGAQLSPDQRDEFRNLIGNMRQLTWQIASKEAVRRDQPLDFLPSTVTIRMKDSRGAERPVPGNRVQEYLDRGAKLVD